jgi:quinol monooxygenase YgiN
MRRQSEHASGIMTIFLVVGLALALFNAATQAVDTPADTAFYAVSYVEVNASSRSAAIAAFKQYRNANQRLTGAASFVRLDTFEQIGRPGHFALIETWPDQKSFDARDQGTQAQLLDALKGIRISGYDQRPYKTLTVGPAPPSGSRAIVVVSHVDVTPNPQVPIMLKRLAEASRTEQGNLRFDVLQHTMRANHFTVIEAWRDQKAFDAHVGASHTKQYRDELQPMTGSPLDERVYQVVD